MNIASTRTTGRLLALVVATAAALASQPARAVGPLEKDELARRLLESCCAQLGLRVERAGSRRSGAG